jgi:indole-3-glycerol phosphate synthase/phosphoribosylanthranilate isomerase
MELPPDIRALLDTGKLDCIQFHGEEEPEECFQAAFPYYKAVRVRNRESLAALHTYRSPRILIDAFSASAQGGTGKRIDSKLVTEAAAVRPLWLAGGISPENAEEIIRRFHPELIDVSSGVEDTPGTKNHHKMKQLFEEAAYAYEHG